MSDKILDIIDAHNRQLSSTLPVAVGSNLVLWSTLSVVTIIAFNILRPRNKIVYEPKSKYHVGDKKPPKIDNGFFSWISPVMHAKEDYLLEKIGPDAVIYLRFLRMLRWLFLSVTLICCAVLIPINVSYNLKNVDPKRRNVLSMVTLQDLEGNILFAHVAVSYLINALVIAFIYFNWRAVVALRIKWFRSDEYQKSFYSRTLMITQVPRKLQSDEGIKSIFSELRMPYPATSVHIGRKVGQLPELVKYHNDAVREFEKVLVKYLKGGKLGKKRPVIKIGQTMGCGGEERDAIDFYTRKLAKTTAAVGEWRDRTEVNKPENYGFASLAAVPYAHIVAHRLDGKHPHGTTVTLAPNPKDIIWKNLTMSEGTKARQKVIGWLWLALICTFYTIPLLVLSLLANLSSLTAVVPFIRDWQKDSETTFAIVNGILPPMVTAIFMLLLPMIFRWLSKFQGINTHSALDRAVIARYFAFLIIGQLIIFSALSVIVNLVRDISMELEQKASFLQILTKFKDLPDKIHSAYLDLAPYYLTLFPLRAFLVIFDLAKLINLAWIWIKTTLFGRTPRDIREWTQPPEFEYAIYYSNILFMAAIGLVYAPLAPLVVLAAAIVFFLSSIVFKYELMYVYVSKVESGGRLWNVAINRLLVCVILMQSMMTLTIGLSQGWRTYYWASCVPPIFVVLLCKIWFNRKFLKQFRYYIPDQAEIEQCVVHSQRADNQSGRLERRFGHPALHADLFTPMVHAKAMPLLSQIYSGKLGHQSTRLDEYGGQKVEATIAPGGIKIAAIDQTDLEYDPALYARDRGEADWDTRSVMTGNFGPDRSSTLVYGKSGYGTPGQDPSAYNRYLQHGPMKDTYELSNLSKSEMSLPLLAARSAVSLAGTGLAPGHSPQRTESPGGYHNRSPSAGPGELYGRPVTPSQGPPGYFAQNAGFATNGPQHNQYPPQPPSRSGSSMGYYARTPSPGPNELGGYGNTQHNPQHNPYHQHQGSGSQHNPYHQQQGSVSQHNPYHQHQRNASGHMGSYPQQQGPAPMHRPSPSGSYSTLPARYQSPAPGPGSDFNMAGRGAYHR